MIKYDVAIIGGGVVGGFTARALSQYKIKTCIIEKSMDLAMGTSGANSGIVHGGYDAKHGSLKSKFNVAGNHMMEEVCQQLKVPFSPCGSMVLGLNEKDEQTLNNLYENGKKAGVKGMEIIDANKIQQLEPNVNKEVTKALYCKSAAIVSPYKLNIRTLQNAVSNGVTLYRDHQVTQIDQNEDGFSIKTNHGTIETKLIINCAGLHADEIAKMVGDEHIEIRPVKGEYLLFDRTEGESVRHVLFQTPSEKGKGVLVSPTTDGNILLGPDANEIQDKEDFSTTESSLAYIKKTALHSIENVNFKKVITTFSGLRATPKGYDFIIAQSPSSENVFHAAGIESPGLTAAPAIGDYILEWVKERLKNLSPNPMYCPELDIPIPFRDMSQQQRQQAIKNDPLYGRIVCRCETVTLAEVIQAIKEQAGATTVDGIKKRTRAGMGRCQGGFCLHTVMKEISKEMNIPYEDVKKSSPSSYILTGRSRK